MLLALLIAVPGRDPAPGGGARPNAGIELGPGPRPGDGVPVSLGGPERPGSGDCWFGSKALGGPLAGVPDLLAGADGGPMDGGPIRAGLEVGPDPGALGGPAGVADVPPIRGGRGVAVF